MKIYGQNLSAVLRHLPWPYKVLTAVGAFFILLTVAHIADVIWGLKNTAAAPVVKPVSFRFAENPVGVLDPSLAARPHGLEAWMAFTTQRKADSGEEMLGVSMAATQTMKGCDLWEARERLGLSGRRDEIFAPDGQTVLRKGVWRVETPTLVYDPDDKGKEWKLFAFRYFWPDEPQDRLAVIQHYSVISYTSASDPTETWSTEEWLFSARKDYPPAPYDQMVLLNLDRLSPQLRDIVMYARPSAVYQDGLLAMTLSAFRAGEASPARVVMISSSDNGNSWRYAGTLLDRADLAGLNAKGRPPYTGINGASLLQQDGKVYLAVSLSTAQRQGAGTLIFAFDDFAHGGLRRDAVTGKPVVLRRVPLPADGAGALGGGTAAYTDACPRTGMMVTEQKGASPYFGIYQTGSPPIPLKGSP